MRRTLTPALLLALAAGVAGGCGKKPAPPPPEAGTEEAVEVTPEAGPSERDRLLVTLKTKHGDARRDAIDRLAGLAASDPAVLDALVALLDDKSNAGPGRTHPTDPGSTREAAVVALLRSGPAGEAALKDKGFSTLRNGLSDRDAAVREHTAHAVELIGPAAKPLAAWLQKLCVDPDAAVRGVAFDAVRAVGVADAAGMAALLSHPEADVRRGAAEAVIAMAEVSGDAAPALTRALDSDDEIIRVAAATGIATAGKKGATAATAEKLAAVIKTSYPEAYDPKEARGDGPESTYWRALAALGKPAVGPAAELLKHKNPLARAAAAGALWTLGADAKPAADALREAMSDDYADVALEAGATLVRLGDKADDAERFTQLVKSALTSTQPGVAAAGVGAVARLGAAGKPFLPDVLALLRSPSDAARFAAVGFVGALDPEETAKHLPAFAKLVGDDSPQVRRRVGAVMESLGPAAAPAAAAVGAALPAETDETARDQFVAAVVAMGPGGKPAVAGLLPLVADADAGAGLRARVMAAVAVADPASPEVAAALVKVAADPDEAIRTAAAHALGKLNPLPDAARNTLAKTARTDPRAAVRVAAVRALADAGPRAKAARSDLDAVANGSLPGADLWGKVAVAAVDGNVQTAAGVVRSGLTDRNPNVRTAAAEALLLIGPVASDIPALVKLLNPPTTADAKAAAATALGRLGPAAKETVPRLTTLLNDKDSEARVAAAEALGRIGPDAASAIPKLRQVVRSDPLAAPTARRALDRLGTKADGPK